MTMKRLMKALGAGAVAIGTLAGVTFTTGILAAAPAEAAKFRVRNCSDVTIYVCSYREDNEWMAIAKGAKSVEPGKRRVFRCLGKRCKAYIAITDTDVKHWVKITTSVAGGVVGAGGLLTAAAVQAAATGAYMTAVAPPIAGGILAGVGIAVGIVYSVQGVKKQSICRRIRDGEVAGGLTRKQRKEVRNSTKDRKEKREEKKNFRKRLGEKEQSTEEIGITRGEYHFEMKAEETTSTDGKAQITLKPSLENGDSC